MNIEEFISHFASQLDETSPNEISANTKFRDLAEWDSLIALSLIAMADGEYGVKLTGEEIKSSQTVSDLFEIVKSKC